MEKDLEDFLVSRGVEEAIGKMKMNKIDKFVIPEMENDELKEYLPVEGDRIAVKRFCKDPDRATKRDKKESLIESLRGKLFSKRKPDSNSNGEDKVRTKRHLLGNNNATKPTRKIELGWLNYDPLTNVYKQVRKRRGGSTRSKDVPKDYTKCQIKEVATSLFFPDGFSQIGGLDEFHVEIRDFSEREIGEAATVGEIYENTGINMLRYYLMTKRKEEISIANDSSGSAISISVSQSTNAPPMTTSKTGIISSNKDSSFALRISNDSSGSAETISVPRSTNAPPMTTSETGIISSNKDSSFALSISNDSSGSAETISVHQSTNVPPATTSHDLATTGFLGTNLDLAFASQQVLIDETSNTLPNEDFMKTYQVILDESENEVFFNFKNDTDGPSAASDGNDLTFQTEVDEDEPVKLQVLEIHRGPLAFLEIIGYFKDPNITKHLFNIKRILPNGETEMAEDTGGVLRDLISEFWSDFYDKCTTGKSVKVPSLRHDLQQEEWRSIGRFLLYGLQRVGYFPVWLAKSFMINCFRKTMETENEQLLSDFLGYIPPSEKDLLTNALENFDGVDVDELLETLGTYDCRTRVTKENFKSTLLEIANTTIIHVPNFVSVCWRAELMGKVSTDRFNDFYKELVPSNRKVLAAMVFPETYPDVTKMVKRYIRELDERKVQLFLRFCIGSDLLILKNILVSYNFLPGLQRRPTANTCGGLLQLGNDYDNYMDFRSEFDAVLESNIWIMDII